MLKENAFELEKKIAEMKLKLKDQELETIDI
jgi:hypothetical protein